MERKGSLLVGGLLIVFGLMGLGAMWGFPFLGFSLIGSAVSFFWPSVVVMVGLAFVGGPFLNMSNRGLGGLFIPGFPILATGMILSFTNLTHLWGAWSWMWSFEVLALAVGFLAAAFWMRTWGLVVPAIIIGVNGLIFLFCGLTGWWGAWAWLWAAEPLAVGLALLALALGKRSSGLVVAGLILCVIAAVGFGGMTLILSDFWWLGSLMGPVMLIGVGMLLLGWGVLGRRPHAVTNTANATMSSLE